MDPGCAADYVQMAARSKLSTELLERRLKPALITAIESSYSVKALMAPDDALARERETLMRRISALTKADELLKKVPTEINQLRETPFTWQPDSLSEFLPAESPTQTAPCNRE